MAQGYMYALMLMYAWLHVCTVTQGYMYAWMTQTQKHTACIGNQESLTNRRQAEALSLTAYTPHAQMEDHNPPRLGQIIAFHQPYSTNTQIRSAHISPIPPRTHRWRTTTRLVWARS